MESNAWSQFSFENNISLVDPNKDAVYSYDSEEQKRLNEKKPWQTDPHYFKYVRISAVALIKMAMHARSGGSIEIMGLMQGKIAHETFVVTDAFPLPVEGTETRVNAQDQAYEYMAAYSDALRMSGRQDNILGWYHSHPGYGCWLSGIDCQTQITQQKYMDPFLAIVVDPDRTISAGKVDIGAFRTYPEGYKPKDADDTGYQTIPLSKIEDFGAHSSQYYPLEISHFKSTLDTTLLDLLWNKYWVSTLSQNPLFTNRDFGTKRILDLSMKVMKSEASLTGTADKDSRGRGRPGRFVGRHGGHTQSASHSTSDNAFEKVNKDSIKVTSEEIIGMFSNVIKERIFGGIKLQQPDDNTQMNCSE
ncbi:JAB1/Mov34/MPN/PAD-1 ubiquitin protease-domain-containing protein [Geopyxis carbonaria]|nr:JAB1/Mov34/MPN/PAD-1 ubiquitin protease-domain-containing protein [Geopyxis carbonaria]